MLEGMAWVKFRVTDDRVWIVVPGSGIVPLVCHYSSGPVRLEKVYPLETYTQEQAANHGIRNYGGVDLNISDLQGWSEEILGCWRRPLKRVMEK